MPDPFDFDDARQALHEVGPAADLWDEAQRRAADGAVPLADGGERTRHPRRWLAVAAAAVLAVGTVAAVAMSDGEQPLHTAGDPSNSTTSHATTYRAGPGGCSFGVSGDPILLAPGPVDPRLLPGAVGPAARTIVHARLGSQTAEIRVPASIGTEPVRGAAIKLRRGTGGVVESADFALVWFSAGEAPCSSFSVTVGGGTSEGNAHAAVGLANRILLPDELPGTDPAVLPGEWQLKRTEVGRVPTDAAGQTFSFTDGRATWTDGCNHFGGTYEMLSATTLRMGEVASTRIACPTNPTAEAVNVVMGAEQIEMSFDAGLLSLTANDHSLVLGPVRSGEPLTTTSIGISAQRAPGDPYAVWPMTGPEAELGYKPAFTGSQDEMAVAFAREVLGWSDAVVSDKEPSEDGRFGGVMLVTSASTGGAVDVWVGPGDPVDLNVVYHVDTPGRELDPESTASVLVHGSIGNAHVSPVPVGTASSTVRFTYGEHSAEGPMGRDIDLHWRAGSASAELTRVPGSVLVLFRNASGQIIGAFGTPLPAGDFAAG